MPDHFWRQGLSIEVTPYLLWGGKIALSLHPTRLRGRPAVLSFFFYCFRGQGLSIEATPDPFRGQGLSIGYAIPASGDRALVLRLRHTHSRGQGLSIEVMLDELWGAGPQFASRCTNTMPSTRGMPPTKGLVLVSRGMT